jgi:hypothetical protein
MPQRRYDGGDNAGNDDAYEEICPKCRPKIGGKRRGVESYEGN